MPSPTERLCREAYSSLVQSIDPLASPTWSPGDEPPDFWLRIDNQRYAIEVTRILWKVKGRAKPISWRQAIAFVRGLIDQARDQAAAKGSLAGKYFVEFGDEMEVCQRLHSDKDSLVQQMVHYITRTQALPTAGKARLTAPRQPNVSICKVAPQGQEVRYSSISFFNAAGLLSHSLKLIGKAVRHKQSKLQSIPKPWVLLIYDESSMGSEGLNSYGCRATARKEFLGQDVPFHTIFVVPANAQHSPFVLFSQNAKWQHA